MKISDDVGSKYRFIILSGQRVAQLQRGAKPRLTQAEKMKFTQIAMQELEDGSLNFNKKALEEKTSSPKAEKEKQKTEPETEKPTASADEKTEEPQT